MTNKTMPRQNSKNIITQGGRTVYLSNKELLAEIKKCKADGKMSDMLASMLHLLCSKYSKKGSFVNYSYNEDMQGYAMMMLVRTWNSFNPDKSDNPFAFFTQCIKNSFIQYLNQEKKHRDVRDSLLIDQGFHPSFSFDSHGTNSHKVEDDQDFHSLVNQFENQKSLIRPDDPIERDNKGVEIMPYNGSSQLHIDDQ